MTKIKAVIFDWAGTTIDYGCFAPVKALKDGFSSIGVQITNETARKPMGLPKMEHVRAIAAMVPELLSEEQTLRAYESFEGSLFADIENHCEIKEYVMEAVEELRRRNIATGSTTGYTTAMMERVMLSAAAHGYCPDFCVTPEQASKGRPYPYMIWENMKHFGIVDPREVVKVGDTAADIDEGKNASCWTAGVIMGSSKMGLTREEVKLLSPDELEKAKKRVHAAYYRYGADYIIEDMSELSSVIDDINRKLSRSEPHKLLTPGPLTTRASVKYAMNTDHCTWDDEYKEITLSVMQDITGISANDDYATVLLQGSGTYAVESMINGLVKDCEKILFLINGAYGNRMLTIAEKGGKFFESLRFDDTKAIDNNALEEKLNLDNSIDIVIAVHCETTTGVINPIEDIAKTAKKHGKKVFVDAMSSFGAYDINMPKLDIDALASSANKCLEGLPGLAFVIARKALLEESKGNSKSHSLDLFEQYQGLYRERGKFRFTSPTNVLLALRQAIDEYKKEGGLTARRERYKKNHLLLTEGLEGFGIRPIVAPENQSYIITTLDLDSIDFLDFYNFLKSKGFIIYPGKLTSKPTFRIGNIGDIYPGDIEKLVAVIGEYINNKEKNN